MMNSIPALHRSLDHFSRAAGNAMRAAEGLAPEPEALRPVDPINPDRGANATGTQPDDEHDSIEMAAVKLAASKNEVKAAVALVRAENEMLGSLLDVFA